MKLIDKMTRDEIVALNSTDLERTVVYICATEGIKMLPEPVKPVKPDIKPDIDAFQLDDFYSFTKEPLDEIAAVFSKNRHWLRSSEYNWSVGSEHKKTKIDDYKIDAMTSVKSVKVFSDAHFAKCESELRTYKELNEQYEKDLKEYEKNKAERENATDWVWDRYHDEMKSEREIESLKVRFEEYKNIANGDEQLALAFLKKAYGIDSYQEERITGKIAEVLGE